MRVGLKFYSSAASTQTALDAIRNIKQKRDFKADEGRQDRRARRPGDDGSHLLGNTNRPASPTRSSTCPS
ncbi:MAG: hypothetical protein WDN48_05620 [Pseudolabrys sp.]